MTEALQAATHWPAVAQGDQSRPVAGGAGGGGGGGVAVARLAAGADFV